MVHHNNQYNAGKQSVMIIYMSVDKRADKQAAMIIYECRQCSPS